MGKKMDVIFIIIGCILLPCIITFFTLGYYGTLEKECGTPPGCTGCIAIVEIIILTSVALLFLLS